MGIFQANHKWGEWGTPTPDRTDRLPKQFRDSVLSYIKDIIDSKMCEVVVYPMKAVSGTKMPVMLSISVMYSHFEIMIMDNTTFVIHFNVTETPKSPIMMTSGAIRDRYDVQCDDPLVLQEIVSAGDNAKEILKWLSVLVDSPCKVIQAVRITPQQGLEKRWLEEAAKQDTWTTTTTTTPYIHHKYVPNSNSITWGSEEHAKITFGTGDYGKDILKNQEPGWITNQYNKLVNVVSRLKSTTIK